MDAVDDVAELLKIDAQAVVALANAAELSGRKIGDRSRFRPTVLDWLGDSGQPTAS